MYTNNYKTTVNDSIFGLLINNNIIMKRALSNLKFKNILLIASSMRHLKINKSYRVKRAVILLFSLFTGITWSQNINQVSKDRKGNPMLLGQTTKVGLQQEPFNNWFNKNFDEYQENDKIIKSIKKDLNDYSIKVFYGTWCGDSKKELPRFYKLMEALDFPEKQLEVFALSNVKGSHKQGPNGEEKGYNIHRVPTFIFYKDGQEVNRIVEHPKETLERDIQTIITGKRYTPNYGVVNYLDKLMKEQSLDSLQIMKKDLIPYLSNYTKGSGELNTYGYALIRSEELDKALYVFDLNSKIYPYMPRVYDSLGEAYFETKNYTEALKNYYKVLSLKPSDENAKEMISKIESKLKT